MTDPVDTADDDNSAGRKKSGKGETDGSFGDGKAGAASGMGMLLSSAKGAQVAGEHRHLVGNSLIEALVEFCADGIRVASAQAELVWNKTFSVVTNFVVFLKKDLPLMARALPRAIGRDSRGLQKRKPPGHNLGLDLKPSGPTE
jgi:hypothetical protein